MICAKCGHELAEGSNYCQKCGKRLSEREFTLSGWVLGSIIAGLVLIGGIGGWLFFHRTAVVPLQTAPSTTPAPTAAKPSPEVTPGLAGSETKVFSAAEIFRASAPSVVTLYRYDADGNPTALGSGFLVAPSTIATNYHVIRGATTMNAHFTDGSVRNVEGVLGYNEEHDVSILKIDPVDAPPLKVGTSTGTSVGDPVVAIGSPQGLSDSLSEGMISGKRGPILQTTAAISPGSSGGPLLNMRGEVIGITTAQRRGEGVEALNFAMPIEWATQVLGGTTTTPLTSVTQAHEVSKEFGPFQFTLPAHQRRDLPFNTPENLENVELRADIVSSGGIGGHLRVIVTRDGRSVYDSGDSTAAQFDLKLPRGHYVWIIENTAMMFPRTITLRGTFSAVR